MKGKRDRYDDNKLRKLASDLMEVDKTTESESGTRGWCYLIEGENLITKDKFDITEIRINNCRKRGFLPVDFVMVDESRTFKGVEPIDELTPVEQVGHALSDILNGYRYYSVNWWSGEEYYIQVLVEKKDLVPLLEPVCRKYHIPIANARGHASILQRAEYTRRFKEAESRGLKSVLLYVGDYDPDGLRISDKIRKTLYDLTRISWKDGETGYDPTNLIIDRIGLNLDFIQEHDLTWIDNLITGSKTKVKEKKSLASPGHNNHKMKYVQEYLDTIGERKCEANALVTRPDDAKRMLRDGIEKYLGEDAVDRFQDRMDNADQEVEDWIIKNDLRKDFERIIKLSGVDPDSY